MTQNLQKMPVFAGDGRPGMPENPFFRRGRVALGAGAGGGQLLLAEISWDYLMLAGIR